MHSKNFLGITIHFEESNKIMTILQKENVISDRAANITKALEIKRFLKLYDNVIQKVNQNVTAPIILSAAELIQLKKLQTLLKPFEIASNEIVGKNYTTRKQLRYINNL